jgi:hypothetical protein
MLDPRNAMIGSICFNAQSEGKAERKKFYLYGRIYD